MDPLDLSIFEVDVHSHFIPGIDDGAQNMDETIQLLEEFEGLGYKKVITTPHVMSDYYRNTSDIILNGLDKVRNEITKRGLSIKIDAAAEYNLDAGFEPKIDARSLLTFGDNHVLFELPFMAEPPMLNDIIWKLQTAGYKPVLAHVERYGYWHQNWEKISGLRDRGVFLQLNINSLTGHYGPGVKLTAERMIDEGIVDLVGSDCHNMKHFGLMQKARKKPYLHKVAQFKNLINHQLS